MKRDHYQRKHYKKKLRQQKKNLQNKKKKGFDENNITKHEETYKAENQESQKNVKNNSEIIQVEVN